MRSFIGYQKGINFGGWFSQCDYSEKRYDNFIKKDDFKRVARWGLDHVRLPIDYNLIQNLDFSFKEIGFKRIEEAILCCQENNLNLVLDLHKTIGFCFDSGEKEEGFFENKKYQNNFISLWKELAKRYGHYPHVAFELLNEVSEQRYAKVWNGIIEETIKAIREETKTTKIIVGSYWNNSIEAIKDLDKPFDENVIYNFHCYSPLIFTHQGAYWIEQMDTNFRMKFSENTDKYQEYTNKYISNEHLDTFKKNSYIDEGYFEDLFKEAIQIAEERKVPLYCGEYGVIDRTEPEEILKWQTCIHKVFEKYGIGRALWSYKEMDFGLVDAHYDDIRESMIKLL